MPSKILEFLLLKIDGRLDIGEQLTVSATPRDKKHRSPHKEIIIRKR